MSSSSSQYSINKDHPHRHQIKTTTANNHHTNSIIDRIFADQITFVKAKYPDRASTDIKPSSYNILSGTKSTTSSNTTSNTNSNSRENKVNKDTDTDQGMTTVVKPKPRSMAEAVAAYTGKRFPTKLEKKLEKKMLKDLAKSEALKVKPEQPADQKNDISSDEGAEIDSDLNTVEEQEEDNTPSASVSASASASASVSASQPESDSESDSESEKESSAAALMKNAADSSDDGDYQTADEEEDDEEADLSEEDDSEGSDDEEEEEEDNDDKEDEDFKDELNELGHPKVLDDNKEELEEEDFVVDEKTQQAIPNIKSISPSPPVEEEKSSLNSTPPTSPENDDDNEGQMNGEQQQKTNTTQLSSSSSQIPDSEFFQIDEAENDRGSNNSLRIYKNWRYLKTSKQPLGLLNQGVTCYMNAAIQALIHTPALQHYLTDVHNNKYSSTISNHSVTKIFADTSAKIWQLDNDGSKKISMINPRKLIRRLQDINCMMSEWQQEDSHEYFMSLMSRLQEDSTPKGHKLNESIVYDIFGGLVDQSVSCKNCGHISRTEQEFYDLSLNLDNKRRGSEDADDQNEQGQPMNKRYSIKKSLYEFFSPELIKTDKKDKSGYVCEKCKQRTNAMKHNKIKRAPETLAIHLKRFRFNGTSSSKLKTGVSFPPTLDLTNFSIDKEPSRYKLTSVVVHEGRSVSSGHYIAHCRQPDGSWSTYDDEYVNRTTEQAVLKNTSVYFLLYTRLTHKSKQLQWDVETTNGKRKVDSDTNNNRTKRVRK